MKDRKKKKRILNCEIRVRCRNSLSRIKGFTRADMIVTTISWIAPNGP